MGRIVRRSQAIRDVKDLWSYIASAGNVNRADALLDKIEQKIEILSEHPTMGRVRDELMAGLRSLPVEGYLIFYIPQEDGIELVRVLYGGRDLEALFEEAEEDDNLSDSL